MPAASTPQGQDPKQSPKLDGSGQAYARGRRKTSNAQVWLTPGSGIIRVNGLCLVEYFPRESLRSEIVDPFVATETACMYDVAVGKC